MKDPKDPLKAPKEPGVVTREELLAVAYKDRPRPERPVDVQAYASGTATIDTISAAEARRVMPGWAWDARFRIWNMSPDPREGMVVLEYRTARWAAYWFNKPLGVCADLGEAITLVEEEARRAGWTRPRARPAPNIPDSCTHGSRLGPLVPPLPECRWCAGTGHVAFENDDFPPGTNACCCTCARCRADAALIAAEAEHGPK